MHIISGIAVILMAGTRCVGITEIAQKNAPIAHALQKNAEAPHNAAKIVIGTNVTDFVMSR